MWKFISAKEYFSSVLRGWWVMAIGFILPGIEFIKDTISRFNNSLFEIPTWLWLTSIFISLFIAQFMAFHRVRVERDKLKKELTKQASELTQLSKPIPEMSLGAKVKGISNYDYYSKAFGGRNEGDKTVHIETILNPKRPIMLNYLALELWGERFEINTSDKSDFAEGLFPMLYQDVSYLTGYVDIPKKVAINTKDAKIYALANSDEYYSEPFSINFEEVSK